MKTRHPGVRLSSAVGLLLITQHSDAHLVSTGLGPVYDSVSHFLLSPQSLGPIVGLALFAGLRGPDHGRWALFTVTAAYLAGASMSFAPGGLFGSLLTAGAFLGIGSLLAADLRIPLALTALVAVAVGLLSGAMTVVDEGTASSALGVVGICATVFVLTALTASLIVPLRIPWLRVAVRVAGSWLAALGLLLAGWAIRGRT